IRTLGVSDAPPVPARVFIIVTGNNTGITLGTARRFMRLRMQDDSPHPDERRGDQPNLLPSIRPERAGILGLIFMILRAFRQVGSPGPSVETGDDGKQPSGGSYPAWLREVDNAVRWLGFPSAFETRRVLKEESDDGAEAGDLAQLWYEAFGQKPI